MTGNGFCGGRSFILQVHLYDSSGQVLQRILSDDTWTASHGPIIADSTYFGVKEKRKEKKRKEKGIASREEKKEKDGGKRKEEGKRGGKTTGMKIIRAAASDEQGDVRLCTTLALSFLCFLRFFVVFVPFSSSFLVLPLPFFLLLLLLLLFLLLLFLLQGIV